MASCEKASYYYDLTLLRLADLPIDRLARNVPEKKSVTRVPSRIWEDLYFDVTPELVDAYEKEAAVHVKKIRENPHLYGYLYFVAEHNGLWYNAAHFDYAQFPLMRKPACVLRRVKKIAEKLSKPHEFEATCLYLLYFFALLVNPSANWITIDYLANGNKYHQFGTRLKADEYHYAKVLGLKLILDTNRGFFNATRLCSEHGKQLKAWTKASKELITLYPKPYEFSPNPSRQILAGTYLPVPLLLSVASYASHDFYSLASDCVLRRAAAESTEEKMEVDQSVKMSTPSRDNVFAILRKNEDDTEEYPYYVVRCQKTIFNKTIRNLTTKFPDLKIAYEARYNPNVVDLYKSIKLNASYIETRFNNLKVENFERLKHDIEKILAEVK